jgi:general stress protein 26
MQNQKLGNTSASGSKSLGRFLIGAASLALGAWSVKRASDDDSDNLAPSLAAGIGSGFFLAHALKKKHQPLDSSLNDTAKLAHMIDGIEIAMMTTVTEGGQLRSRPMMTQKQRFDGQLWFFTSNASPKSGEIEHDHHVNLSYADPDSQRYVSVSGRARIVRDPAKLEQFWNPVFRAWFPEGLSDPELALVRVDVEKAEYWDSHSKKLVHLVGFTKAILTGQRYEESDDEHRKLDFIL